MTRIDPTPGQDTTGATWRGTVGTRDNGNQTPVTPSNGPHYGLVGYPLTHSLSPVMHAATLRACELPGDYSLYRVAPEQLEDFVRAMRQSRLSGLNVTIPHKVTIMAYLDHLTPLAARIGSVNTLYWDGDALWGHNTDHGGFSQTLPDKWPKTRPIIMFGAGGAARAVLCALADQGARSGVIINRTPEPARRLCVAFASDWYSLSAVDATKTAELAPLFAQCGMIINATPDPAAGFSDTSIARWIHSLPADTLVYDLSYTRHTHGWLAKADKRGLITMDGREMLVGQAAEAFERWTGRPAPRDVMRQALSKED